MKKILLVCLLFTASAAASQAQAPAGDALHFNGSNYVTGTLASSPTIVSPRTTYTVEAWVKPDGTDDPYNIISISKPAGSAFDPFALVVVGTDLLLSYSLGTTTASDALANYPNFGISPYHWNHIAIVYDGLYNIGANQATISIYLNGVLRNSRVVAITWTNPFKYGVNTVLNLGQGGQQDFGGVPLVGALDEVKIWGTARTPAQILQDMSSPVTEPGTNPDLLLYYDFDHQGEAGADNTGNPTAHSLTDRAQLGINGNLTGFDLTGYTSNWVGSYAMVVPTAAAVTDINTNGFTAHWGLPVVNNYDNFKVRVATDSLFNNVVPGYDSLTTDGRATSLVITGLQPGTQYYYRVRADKEVANGVGAYSASVAVKTIGSPVINNFTPAFGHAGTLVTIHGNNFNAATAVTFGGTTATSYAVVSDKIITATIGAGASGTIGITTPGGTGSSVNTFLLVKDLSVTSVVPASASTGMSITIKGTGFSGSTAVKIGGAVAAYFTVPNDSTINAVVGMGTNGSVTVTNVTDFILPATFTYIPASNEPGNALQFDGVDDYVTIPNPLNGLPKFTVEFWMKTTQTASNGPASILDTGPKGVAWLGIYLLGNKLLFRSNVYNSNHNVGDPSAYGDTLLSVSDVNTGQWVHVAVVKNLAEDKEFVPMSIYINGRLDAQTYVHQPDSWVQPQSITIGASPLLDPGTFFNGAIDELRFIIGEDSEIIRDMTRPEPSYDTNLYASYHFNQGVSAQNNADITTLVDYGTGNLSGTLHNFELNSNTGNWVESYAMAIPVTAPPTNLLPNGFTANWSLPAYGEIDSLKLTVATDAAFTNLLPGFNDKPLLSTATSQAIASLSPSTPYYYRVRADKASIKGQGANSPSMKVITPSVSFTPPGNAIRFDGADDYIRIANPVSKTFTIAFWMNTTQTGAGNPGEEWFSGTGIIDGKYPSDQYDFGISLVGSKLAFGYGIPYHTIVSTSDVNTGQWIHVAIRWYGEPLLDIGNHGGTSAAIFINGVQEAYISNYVNPFYDFSVPILTIGANNTLSHYYKGLIDELQIYDGDIRTAGSRVANEMYKQPSIFDDDLWSYYDFEQGLPAQNNAGITTLYDRSLKNNNGTLYNFALDGHTSNWVGSYAMVAPTALAATSVARRGFTANWTPPVVGQPDGYKITVATDAAFTQIVPGCDSLVAAGNAISLPIAGLVGGTQYYYRVRAYIAIGEGQGNYSNAVSVTTNTCTPGVDMLAANTNEGNGSIASGQSILLMVDGSGCREVASLQSMGISPVAGNIAATVWVDATQPAKYVKRHYEITPVTADGITPAANASTATGKVTLYFTQQEFDDFNADNSTQLPKNPTDIEGNIPNLRIEKRSGISSDGSGSPNTYPAGTPDTFKPSDKNGGVVWNATAIRWEISFDVTGFSGFFVKTAGTALPLRLISFSGTQEATTNKLQWKTADEVNTKSFELESSKDGRSFQKVATINAVSTGSNSYEYSDAITYKGIHYYRLKMIDVDGTFTYSRMVSLRRDGKGGISLFPNPVSDQLNLSLDNSLINSDAKLYDISGKLLQTIKITSGEQLINVKPLPIGMYVIKFKDGSSGTFLKE